MNGQGEDTAWRTWGNPTPAYGDDVPWEARVNLRVDTWIEPSYRPSPTLGFSTQMTASWLGHGVPRRKEQIAFGIDLADVIQVIWSQTGVVIAARVAQEHGGSEKTHELAVERLLAERFTIVSTWRHDERT